MKIDFIKQTHNSWGGGLAEPFRHLGTIISDRFQAEEIAFSFEELEICLAYPSPKTKKQDERYQMRMDWFNKLPIYYRGKKMVRITVPFDNKQENLTDLFQLIYKVFDIFASKKKKADIFDYEKIKSALIQLETELQTTDLWELNHKYKIRQQDKTREMARQDRMIREQNSSEKTKLIYDLRFYYHLENIGNLYFAPYDNQFCYEILEKLRQKKFKLPHYTHLYIQVSETFEKSLLYATRLENWFVFGIAVLENPADYATKKENEKKQIVFDLIKQGLNDIATIDKLDSKTLNEVLDEVEQKHFLKP